MKKSASKSKTSSSASPTPAGHLVILSAPSGAGKTTIVDRLLKRHRDWVRSISVTTREPRAGEKNGEDYMFVSPAEFKSLQTRGELLESARIFEHDYGTPKSFVTEQIQKGKTVMLAIDIQGTAKLKKMLEGQISMLTIFVLPPSVKVLRERLEMRKTESPAQIQRRIETAQEEIKAANDYDHTVINQNLDQTILEIEGLIDQYKKKGETKNELHSA